MTLAIGSLVKARGREWVVLPGSSSARSIRIQALKDFACLVAFLESVRGSRSYSLAGSLAAALPMA